MNSSPSILAVFLLLSPAPLFAQETQAASEVATPSTTHRELQLLVETSQSNLGQIQTWRGRARVRLERMKVEASDEASKEVAVGTVSFVYDLNHGKFQSNWNLDTKASTLNLSTPSQIQARFENFNPVCWQFPMKFNIIGKSFGHFQRNLNDKELSGRMSRRDSTVRFWIGPSEQSCDIYELDLKRGASLLRSQSMDKGEPRMTWTLVPQRVDGIWIARKTTRRSMGPAVSRVRDC